MGYARYRAGLSKNSHLPAKSRDGRHLTVMANIELPEEVVPAIDNGADGIGLYRTEFQYMGKGRFPNEEQLFDKYRGVVEVMNPKPVTIRTLDINGDKTIDDKDDCGEPNPALGLRAIRYCLKNPKVFQTQLRAILRTALHGNVRLLFPMISCLEELRQAKTALRQAAASLGSKGLEALHHLKTGIMIEVPAAVIMADVMAREVDFFSIGTNDLIQYTMAIDRDNRDLIHLNQPLAPPIIRMIKWTVDAAKQNGIAVYMCGEMAADPLHTPLLLGMGLDELSMNPQSIPMVKNMVRSLDAQDTGRIVEEIMRKVSTQEVVELIETHFGDLLPAAFNGG
jgi:phosphotransferase system enzyme I (PtsI)